MIKAFYLNKKGKIEFTKEELEKLLNEVWYDGKNSAVFTWNSPYYWSTSPSVTCVNSGVTTTTATVNANPNNIGPVQIEWKDGDTTNATRNNK